MDPACDCELCQLAGQCQLLNGSCAPASEDDCRRPSGACEVYGECALGSNLSGPACVPGGDDDCRASELCVKYGACSVIPDFPHQCFVVTDDDCAESAACVDLGCCTMVDGACSRSDGSCPSTCCGDELC